MNLKVKEIKALSSDEEMSDRQTDSSLCCDSVSDTSTEICRKDVGSRQVFNFQDRQTDHLPGYMRHNRDGSSSCLSDDSSGTVIPNTGYHQGRVAGQNGGNQVQIVYRTGERTMELNCHLMGDNGEMEKLVEDNNLGNFC